MPLLDSSNAALENTDSCRVHSLEFHKTSYWVHQILFYLCSQRRNACLCNVQLSGAFGITQGAIWQPPVGTIAESNTIVESCDLDFFSLSMILIQSVTHLL